MKIIVFGWILLVFLLPGYLYGSIPGKTEIQEKMNVENRNNRKNSTINAATGRPVSATIFVNNSLSCCLDPVAGFFEYEYFYQNKKITGSKKNIK